MSKKKFILSIDGIDGTGKSTISSYVAQHFNARIVKGVLDQYSYIIDFINDKVSIDCKYLYYLSAYIHSVLQINNIKENIIIIDRSLYSNIAYHLAFGSVISIDGIFHLINIPNYSVYLSRNLKVCLNQLQQKKKIDWYETEIIKNPHLIRKIENIYEQYGLERIENINILETTQYIIKQVEKRLNS